MFVCCLPRGRDNKFKWKCACSFYYQWDHNTNTRTPAASVVIFTILIDPYLLIIFIDLCLGGGEDVFFYFKRIQKSKILRLSTFW